MLRWVTILGLTLVAAVGGLGSVASQSATPAATPAACRETTAEENSALVRAYWEEVYNGHDPARASAFLADDFVRHDPGLPEAGQPGLADDIARTAAQLASFPDLRVTVDDLVAAGDEVAARLTWRGTQLGPLAPWGAPATGRTATFAGVSIVRVACGRLAEEWAVYDDLTMFRDLGIISDAELATAATPEATAPAAATPTPVAAKRPPAKPRVFIGSSVEGLPVAEALEQDLQYVADVTIWDQGTFHLSHGTLADLDQAGQEFDFAVFVLTPDDVVTKRGRSLQMPRDNVVFELGFFMGRLGVDRTFLVYDRDAPLALPSDLSGVTAATYGERADGNLEAALGPAAAELIQAIDAATSAEEQQGP